jgi:hypothetical protein
LRGAALAVLALAILGAAPAWAAKAPAPIDADPMTVSGRFDLPKAGASPFAGRIRLGQVEVDRSFAAEARLDPAALDQAVREAAGRSLANFGWLAGEGVTDVVSVDLKVLPLAVERAEDGVRVTTRIDMAPRTAEACLAHPGEGRFKALAREHSGGGRRAFAIGASVALGLVTGGAGVNTFMPAELATASAQNRALNAQRQVGAAEGVAPGFGDPVMTGFAAMAATKLALADYIAGLGSSPACAASPAPPTT